MDLLNHPDAQALLADAEVSADDVRACLNRLNAFAERYLPRLHRSEQRAHALTILQGKFSALQRKTTEPIATQAGQKRRPLQLFVGAGGWQDRPLLDELRRHVGEELADREAVFVLDPSGFAKKGDDSCGVARQWCGRLGKVDNCQVGVFLAYASRHGKALLDSRLYLPLERAADAKHRAKTYVPQDVTFQEKWRLGLELLDRARTALPGRWVAADDEFGRSSEFRGELRWRRLKYVLDVPCNTLVRDLSERRPPRQPGGKARRPAFQRADQWAARQPAGCWRTVKVRDGEKGPLRVKVLVRLVQTKDEDGRVGGRERLLVLRSVEAKPRTWYALSNARQAKRWELAGVHGARHRVEELLGHGKGEVGLGHYEVRSWVGWHHHMTLSLLALWFLELERRQLGGKNAGHERAAGAADLGGVAATTAQRRTDRGGRQPSAAA